MSRAQLVWQEALVALVLSAFMALTVWCWLQPDVVQVQVGEQARAEMVEGLEQQQRECAHDRLRSAYARGEPSPDEVDAAYAACDLAAGWR